VAVLRGHSSYITAIDWTSDSRMLRSCSGDYELLHWWIETKKLVSGEVLLFFYSKYFCIDHGGISFTYFTCDSALLINGYVGRLYIVAAQR
jgi:hypothetical protein